MLCGANATDATSGGIRTRALELLSATRDDLRPPARGVVASTVSLLAPRAVLFDSQRVEHEVLVTQRERACLIGWFHSPTGAETTASSGVSEAEPVDPTDLGWS